MKLETKKEKVDFSLPIINVYLTKEEGKSDFEAGKLTSCMLLRRRSDVDFTPKEEKVGFVSKGISRFRWY